jgi:osmotically-inducible protein OsmY
MRKRGKRWFAFVLLGLGLVSGCESGDPERLARVGRKVSEKLHTTVGQAQEKLILSWKMSLTAADDVSLENRVALRLRWDQVLVGTQIDVRAAGDMIELNGTIPNESQRRRAKELAETTAGVRGVRDRLLLASR